MIKNQILTFAVFLVLGFQSAEGFAYNFEHIEGTPYTTTDPWLPGPGFSHPTEKNSFSIDETPFLRGLLRLTGEVGNFDISFVYRSYWKFEGQENDWGYHNTYGVAGGSLLFAPPINIYSSLYEDWDLHKKPGNWTVQGLWSINGDPFYSTGEIPFTVIGPSGVGTTVTPEPASLLLFPLGAAALGYHRRRKNRR